MSSEITLYDNSGNPQTLTGEDIKNLLPRLILEIEQLREALENAGIEISEIPELSKKE